MLWDENFWENIILNYISSVGSGITLLVIGGIVGYFSKDKLSGAISKFVEKMVIDVKNQINQNNQGGGSNINISSVDNITIQTGNPPPQSITDSASKPNENSIKK